MPHFRLCSLDSRNNKWIRLGAWERAQRAPGHHKTAGSLGSSSHPLHEIVTLIFRRALRTKVMALWPAHLAFAPGSIIMRFVPDTVKTRTVIESDL